MSLGSRRVAALLGLILIVAAGVRFWGIGFGLPHTQARPDETVAIGVALAFLRGDFSPRFFDYPWLYMWAISALYVAYYAWGAATGLFGSLADVVASWPVNWEPFFLMNRAVSATLGTATVAVVFAIARRLWGAATGLVAALFMALAFLHVRDSHFGTTDITMTFFVMAATALLLRAHDSKRPVLFAAAGLVAGLAAATKYNGVLLFVSLAASTLVHVAESPGARWAALVDRRLWLFTGAFLVTFAVGVPFIILDNGAFNAAMAELWHSMNNATPDLALTSGWRHHLELSLRHGLGLPLLATALAGTALILARDTRTGVLLLSFPLVYFAVASSLQYLFFRYTMPIVPFLAIAAARAVTWAVDQTPAVRWPRVSATLTAVLATAIVWPSAVSTWEFDRIISRPDSRVMLVRWFAENVPPGSSVLQSGSPYGYAQFGRELGYTQWLWDRVRLVFLAGGRRPTPTMRPDWIVVQESPLPSQTQPIVHEFLGEGYAFAWRLNAVSLNKPHLYDQQDAFFMPYAGFDGVTRPGPNFTVYKRMAPQPIEKHEKKGH